MDYSPLTSFFHHPDPVNPRASHAPRYSYRHYDRSPFLDVSHCVFPHVGHVFSGAAMVPVCQFPRQSTCWSHIHRHAYPRYLLQQCELVSFPETFLHALNVDMWCEKLST